MPSTGAKIKYSRVRFEVYLKWENSVIIAHLFHVSIKVFYIHFSKADIVAEIVAHKNLFSFLSKISRKGQSGFRKHFSRTSVFVVYQYVNHLLQQKSIFPKHYDQILQINVRSKFYSPINHNLYTLSQSNYHQRKTLPICQSAFTEELLSNKSCMYLLVQRTYTCCFGQLRKFKHVNLLMQRNILHASHFLCILSKSEQCLKTFSPK